MSTTANQNSLNSNGQNIVRIVIASYFIAVSLGLIAGTSGGTLALALHPDPNAEMIGNYAVMGLAFLVLSGMWLRPAALLLAQVMFWASFLTHFGPQGSMLIGDFWRDLALIGALFLTYAQSDSRDVRRRSMLRFRPKVRKVVPKRPVSPRRIRPDHDLIRPKITPLAPRIAARDEGAGNEPDNIFADEFGKSATG